MKTIKLALPVVLAAQFLGACGSQAGEEYRGEPLLRMKGSVVIQNPNPPDNLVPAIAFLNTRNGTLDFAEVQVAGEFPAQFTLDVFEPPPEGCILVSENPEDENEPRFAMGFITAVNADHPDSVAGERSSGGHGCDRSGCTDITEVCIPGEGCYRRVTECDSNGANCNVVEESGNPALARGWLRYVAGLSRNYSVFYFPEGVQADTSVAYSLNDSRAMAPGYYLVEMAELSQAEQDAREACIEGAAEEALDRFNTEHGSAYEHWFDVPIEASAQHRATNLVARERGCQLSGVRMTPVRDPAHQSITVTISPDVKPVSLF
jgi:hypothetical protein